MKHENKEPFPRFFFLVFLQLGVYNDCCMRGKKNREKPFYYFKQYNFLRLFGDEYHLPILPFKK